MPVYEYKCAACVGKFELIRPISRAEEAAPCPECGAPSPRAISCFASISKCDGGINAPMGGPGPGNCEYGCANCGG